MKRNHAEHVNAFLVFPFQPRLQRVRARARSVGRLELDLVFVTYVRSDLAEYACCLDRR